MKLKAKQVFCAGAFIVLTVIGYMLLPKDEVVIKLDEESTIDTSYGGAVQKNQTQSFSGDIKGEDVIYVHIEGAINNPGIKEVSKGTRLFELIEKAGGEQEDADITRVNLASILKDEQKVYIPYKKIEEVKDNSNQLTTSSAAEYSVSINENPINDLININNATVDELQKLEGIGPSMAKKILDYRESVGYFSDIEEIKNVSGIGEAKYNKIKDNICT